MRRVSTQVVHATAFQSILEEVQQIQSYESFGRESLQIDDSDVANLDDVEDGELFENMKRCQYIRWGKTDDVIIEEMTEKRAVAR